MRHYESCEGACSERRLELVKGGDYDELTAAAAACRVRIAGLWAVVGELTRTEPSPGEWRVAYEALQQSARPVLRRSGPAAGGHDDELLSPAKTVIVWRCQDCGGIDAPQPCIDVCIWGPAGWMRSRMNRSGRGRPSTARWSSRWLGCSAGSRSPRRVTGNGSEAAVPCNRKHASLSSQGDHAALRARGPSGRLKPMDNAALLAPSIRGTSAVVGRGPVLGGAVW